MKVKILRENLLKSLARANRIISTKTQLPILQNVLIKTENGMLKILATNMETSIICLIGVKEEKPGGACVSSRLLTELVTTIADETVVLEEKEGSLFVVGAKTHAQIPTLPAGEFPPLESTKEKNSIVVGKDILKSAFSGLLFAAATDEGRPVLTGVKIQMGPGKLSLAATDGYRLSVKNLDFKGEGGVDVVLPARALTEVLRVVLEEKDAPSTTFGFAGEGQVIFTIGDTKIITRTIDGEYPNFEKIIPKSFATRAVVDKDELEKAVKSASIFARDNANIIKIHLDEGLVTVSANTPQVGQNTVDVEANVEGDGADIAFNSRFLIEFLSNFDGDQVVFEMTGSLNPGAFKASGDETYLHIIMPVRVQN
jgi:DNA polymerase III subunit beta